MESLLSPPHLKPEDENDVASMVMDIEILLFGSFMFLGVVFFLGLLVNLPAAVIYCRSRQIRGFTDKFILFVLIVDLLSLFIFIPISFIFVLEYSVSLGETRGQTEGFPVKEEIRPFFIDGEENNFVKNGQEKSDEVDGGEFSSFCVQQWIFLVHKLIFIMAANLSVLGALKIAVERYLAVVAPLHYHKILKSSVIFFVALFSFILSLASAVITAVDPADFSGSFLFGGQCNLRIFDHQSASSSSWSPTSLSKKQVSSIKFDSSISSERNLEGKSDFSEVKLEDGEDPSILKSLRVGEGSNDNYPYESLHEFSDISMTPSSPVVAFWWWPVLKLVHATVFFLIPVTVMLFMYLRIRTEARRQNSRMSYRNKSSFILPSAVTGAAMGGGGEDVKKSVGFNVDGLHQVFGKFKLVQRLKRKTRMDRAARVAVLTIGLSVLCFGPLFLVQILSAVTSLTKSNFSINPWGKTSISLLPNHPEGSTSAKFAKFLLPTLLACLHPLLSPLVYVYRYKRVRDELKSLLKKLISRCCCFCCTSHPSSSSSSSASSTDCQEVVCQFNHLAQQKLPSMPSAPHKLESQSATISDGDTAIRTIDGRCDILYYDDDEEDAEDEEDEETTKPVHSDYILYPHLHPSDQCHQHQDYDEDDLGTNTGLDAGVEFSDMESGQEQNGLHVISIGRSSSSNSNGSNGASSGLFSILNTWMTSYSRRWNQHRESVTSTASFITLLSNRSRSIPSSSSAADVI